MTPTGVFLFAQINRPSFLGWSIPDDHVTLSPMHLELTPEEEHELIRDLATRAGSATEIASWYGCTTRDLRQFVDANRPRLEAARKRAEEPVAEDTVTPSQLDELWISNKFERLKRYQELADILYKEIKAGNYEGAELAMAVREYRSYCTTVANELGQLMHRGAGEAGTGDTLDISIEGVDMNALR